MSKICAVFASAALLMASGTGDLAAQGTVPPAGRQAPDPFREAIRLRQHGDFPGAARLLRTRVDQDSSDAAAIRMLAQTLYWMGEQDSARATYDIALSRHPGDAELRLEYGRMLVETRRDRRAHEVLLPMASVPSAAARAETLLGTSAYWNGDFTSAVRHFRRALQADSSATDARRQWREIAAATAAWIRFGSSGRHDDQPLDRIAPEAEAGGFITPLWSFRTRGETSWYRREGGVSRTVLAAAGTVAGYIPSLRLDAEASVGIVRRGSAAPSTDITGRLALRVRLPGHASLGVRGERKPYFFTRASLATNVMVEEGAVTIALGQPNGWMGEGSYARQRYPDRNTIEAAHAWLLAPLVRGSGLMLQAGYALSAQHAREGRFMLADSTQAFPPGHPLFNLAGRYAPYYTPDHLIAHSALAAVEFRPRTGGVLRLDASYAMRARDDAPVFEVTGAPPAVTLGTSRRAFSPWQARASLERPLAPGLALYANVDHARTVFYSATSGGLHVVYRFSTAAIRKVERF